MSKATNIIIDRLLVRYYDDGPESAPVVLLLHGWGTDAHSFDDLTTHLADRFRIIRLDLPGFGGSQTPPATWHITDYAMLVQAFVRKLQLTRIQALIGHSFGGRIAIKATGQKMLAPAKLVLMGSAGVKHSQSLRNLAFKLIAKLGNLITSLPGLSALRTRLRHSLYRTAGSTDYLTAGPLRQVFLNTIGEDLQADATGISAPALLLWGAFDTDTPPADGQRLASKIPHATFHMIEQAGHYVFLDAPADVQRHLDEFLA